MPPLLRQDTFSLRMNQSIRRLLLFLHVCCFFIVVVVVVVVAPHRGRHSSLILVLMIDFLNSSSDDQAEKHPSLLDSEEAHISGECLDKLREQKSVQKARLKMDKELHALHKKYEKLKDRGESLVGRE